MGIFSSIKKSRKKSKDIDEKIEYLNKECQKTGLQEVMTTTGMYFATGQEPNASHNAFKALSHDGQSLGFSGANYNIFTEPIGGLKYSPPHPVSGERRAAQSWFGIATVLLLSVQIQIEKFYGFLIRVWVMVLVDILV